MLNTLIPPKWDDVVYFFAQELVFDKLHGSWLISVNPSACLVTLHNTEEGFPTVQDLRLEKLQEESRGNRISYKGRMLFSAGVILLINQKILLLLRDADAPFDPEIWTSPAGRCDREPLLTAFKEFYEEVILFDGLQNSPVFVIFEGSSVYLDYLKKVYSETLRRKGLLFQEEQWSFWKSSPAHSLEAIQKKVRTQVKGGKADSATDPQETYESRFVVFWDKPHNTLELRTLASITIPPEQEKNLLLMDGEQYNRKVNLFSLEDFDRTDQSAMSQTMVDFRSQLKTSWKDYWK